MVCLPVLGRVRYLSPGARLVGYLRSHSTMASMRLRALRHGRLTFLLLSAVIVLDALMLTRIEHVISVEWAGLRWSPFQMVGALILLVVLLGRRSVLRRNTVVYLVMLLFPAVAIAHLVARSDPATDAIFAVMTLVGPMACFVPASRLNRMHAKRLQGIVTGAALILALLGVASVIAGQLIAGRLGWEEVLWRGVTPVGGPISTGAILLLVWPLLLREALDLRLTGFLSVVAISLSIVAGGSRAIAAVATAMLLVTWAAYWKTGLTWRRLGAVVAGLILIVVTVGGVVRFGVSLRAGERLLETGTTSEIYRLQSQLTGLDFVAERPVTGHGPGSVYSWMRRIGTSVDGQDQIIRRTEHGATYVEPHNMYLMATVEYGIPLTVAVLLLWMVRLRSLGRHLLGRLGRVGFCTVGVLAFLVQALGSSHLFVNPRVALFFWIWLGTTVALAENLDLASQA